MTWNGQQVVSQPVANTSLDPPLEASFQGGVWQSGTVLRIEFDDMSVEWNEQIFFSDALSQCVNASSAIGTVQHTVTLEANAYVITFTTDKEGNVYFPRISEKSILLGANSGGAAITITD